MNKCTCVYGVGGRGGGEYKCDSEKKTIISSIFCRCQPINFEMNESGNKSRRDFNLIFKINNRLYYSSKLPVKK